MPGGRIDHGAEFTVGDADTRAVGADEGVDVGGGNKQSIGVFGHRE